MTKFKYFNLEGDGFSGIFRYPDNGLRLFEQKILDVEMFDPNELDWKKGYRERLYDQSHKGWFSEKDDEIAEDYANDLIRKLKEKLR